MTDENTNNVALHDEQLVAYLDGELDAESRRRIEELLATDEKVRSRVQELEQTWSLLDDLETAPAGGKFVESTLEMVAVAAGKDAERFQAEAPRRRRRYASAVVGGLALAMLAGFLATMLLWSDPNRQLADDLSVLENLDRYRPVGDIAFLRQLRDRGLFSKEEGETSIEAAVGADESLDQRRARIENMSQAEKQQLARLQERFESLDRDQQQRLVRLDQAIRADADAQELRRTMGRYYEWVMTLPLFTRAELADMPTADRIKSVKKHLQQEQARDDRRALGRQDAEVLTNWVKGLVNRHEKTLLEALPPAQRKKLADATPQMRQGMLLWLMWQSNGPGRAPAMLTEDDLARLRAELSPKARERLESRPIGEQWQQVAGWLRHLMRQRPMHGRLTKADDQRLADFFENELNDAERDRLLAMPGEEMQRELQQLYLRRTRPPEPHGHRGDWPRGERPAPKEWERKEK